MFVVVGSTNVDLFISGLDRLPHWGADEFAVGNMAWCDQPLTLSIGGNGANTAYVLGKLGAPVCLASAIGVDPLGDMVAGWLANAGVDLRWLQRRTNAGTSTTTVVSTAAGSTASGGGSAFHRLSFHHPGAYATFTAEDLPPGWSSTAQVLLITGYPLLTRLRPHGCRALLEQAKAAGVPTALDVGPAVGEVATLAELAPLLPALDILLANEYELSLLGGDGAAVSGLAGQVERVLAAGVRTLVVRQGKSGATVYTRTGLVHAPAQPVTVRQTVGAGDAFNAGFMLALSQGKPLSTAAEFGNQVAAKIVSSSGGVLDYEP